MSRRFDVMAAQLTGERPPELPDAPAARVHVARDDPQDVVMVGVCAAPGCRRLTLGWLCVQHRRRQRAGGGR